MQPNMRLYYTTPRFSSPFIVFAEGFSEAEKLGVVSVSAARSRALVQAMPRGPQLRRMIRILG